VDGVSTLVPLTISWSQVLDPASPNGGYNWEVSRAPDFADPALRNSTAPSITQAPVSGLVNGTYYWRVQAVTNDLRSSAWSAPRSFAVTGVGPEAPARPVLDPALGGTTLFHPMEAISFTWSAAAGAGAYVLEASRSPSFPLEGKLVTDNIRTTRDGLVLAGDLAGTWFVRVYAVSTTSGKVGDTAGGVNVIASLPSNSVSVSVEYANPVGPPPEPLGPANGASLALPVTLAWADGYNPQDLGYEAEVSQSPSFSNCAPLTASCVFLRQSATTASLNSLASGTWFWRIRSVQGDASPTTAAVTAWSPTRSFTVASAPPAVASIAFPAASAWSGQEVVGRAELTAVAPAGGVSVNLASSDPNALPVPASVLVPAGTSLSNEIRVRMGQVTAPTPVTVTASLGPASASFALTVQPPSLKRIGLGQPDVPSLTGGAPASVLIELNGLAPPGGAVVSLASTNPSLVRVPATATVDAGLPHTHATAATSAVTATTVVTISASWNGVTRSGDLTLTPGLPVAAVALSPTAIVGQVGTGGTVDGLVELAAPTDAPVDVALASSDPAVAQVPSSVRVPGFGGLRAGFLVSTASVASPAAVTIAATAGGVTKTATLTVNPAAPALAALTVSPSSVIGGGQATGTVTLGTAAPGGGTVVTLSDNSAAATTPASVTVPAGATSATFAVSTNAVSAPTSVTLTATLGGLSRTATLSVNPPGGGALAAPALSTPGNKARVGAGATVTFSWSAVSGAAGYELQVDTSSTIAAPFTVNPTVTATQFATNTLPPGKYWWRVRAKDAAGTPGPWSAVRELEVR
jgi:hypothetical protein